MKPEANSQLQTALKYLNIVHEDEGTLNAEEVKFSIGEAIQAIKSAIYVETPHTSTKFDIYKIASKDDMRPVMCGVFHDKGYKVASDATVLVAVRDAYDEALEGHILDRKGQDIIGKYPKLESVFPSETSEEKKAYTLDTAAVYELLRQEKAEKKAAGRDRVARRGYVKVGDTFFRADKLAMICTFMDAYGAKEITTYGPLRAAAVYAPDGSKALVMPAAFASNVNDCYHSYNTRHISDTYEKEKDAYLWLEVA